MTVPHSSHEFTLVPRTISPSNFPLALDHIVLEFPLVNNSIFKLHSALSVQFARYDLACVYISVPKFENRFLAKLRLQYQALDLSIREVWHMLLPGVC